MTDSEEIEKWGENHNRAINMELCTEQILPDFAKKHISGKEIKDVQVLEVGCGICVSLNSFVMAGFNLTGIDQSAYGIEISKKRFPNVNFYNIRAQEMSKLFDKIDKKFDLVYTVTMLQHNILEHKIEIIKEIRKVMKDDGLFLTSESCGGGAYPDIDLAYSHPGDPYVITRDGWIKLMRELGFSMVDIIPNPKCEKGEYIILWKKKLSTKDLFISIENIIRDKCICIETGIQHHFDMASLDDYSTSNLLDCIVSKNDGMLYSFDNDVEHIKTFKESDQYKKNIEWGKHLRIIEGDSVQQLKMFANKIDRIDLAFLDSKEFDEEHMLNEFKNIEDKMDDGSIVICDDIHNPNSTKYKKAVPYIKEKVKSWYEYDTGTGLFIGLYGRNKMEMTDKIMTDKTMTDKMEYKTMTDKTMTDKINEKTITYKAMTDNLKIVNAQSPFPKYFLEAKELYEKKLAALEGEMRNRDKDWLGVSRNDAIVTYMNIRNFRPRVVMEMGCSHGWLSQWILHALRANETDENGFKGNGFKGNGFKGNGLKGVNGFLYAFEINPEYINRAKEYTKEFRDISEFIEGDITPSLSSAFGLVGGHEKYVAMPSSKKNTLMKTIGKIGYVDFLVVDAYSNYQFGKWWTTNIVPYITKNGIAAVHDIVYENGEIIPDLKIGDESIAVKELLKNRPGIKVQLDYLEGIPEEYQDYRDTGFLFLKIS